MAVVDRYRELRNMRNVASEFQLFRTTVARMLKDHGVDASRRLTERQIAVPVELYEQRLRSATLGKRLRRENHTVFKELRKRGVEIRARGATASLKRDPRVSSIPTRGAVNYCTTCDLELCDHGPGGSPIIGSMHAADSRRNDRPSASD